MYTLPNAPWSAICLALTYLGVKNSSSAYISRTPFLRQTSIIASASSSVMHKGFSQTTCLPALAMSAVICACRQFGAAIVTISTSFSASILR
jgi:hypothetical protein